MFYRTFNPGPSQISDAVKADIASASEQNIIGISHRSSAFIDITEKAVHGLRKFFKVPADYHVLFTSSASEAMELTIRNLVNATSFHFTNGHFSELFSNMSIALGKKAINDSVEWGKQNKHDQAVIPTEAEIITITYNETSTGVTCDNKTIRNLSKKAADKLLVVDITSVAGCLPLEIDVADVWLFSVQKGMGLPSGLGIMFISPRAHNRSQQQQHTGLFNFSAMAHKMVDYQTIHTPNVLGIYLLAKQLERWNKSDAPSNYEATRSKAALLDDFISSHMQLDYFVKLASARSQTTVCITAIPEVINRLLHAAKDANLVIGAGYGKLKSTTCRIANFPALSSSDMKHLIKVLSQVLN
jgi:phosphoserine aminotransferase